MEGGKPEAVTVRSFSPRGYGMFTGHVLSFFSMISMLTSLLISSCQLSSLSLSLSQMLMTNTAFHSPVHVLFLLIFFPHPFCARETNGNLKCFKFSLHYV